MQKQTLSKVAGFMLSLTTISAIWMSPAQAFAQTATVNTSTSVTAAGTTLTARQQAGMTLRRENADREIDRRDTAMTNAIARVNAMKRISADQKASLISQLQANITDLTNLKAKIDSDTDAATLKADKQSIVNAYRIFALLIPKVEIMAHADMILDIQNQMVQNDTTIQARITAAQQAGKDVTAANTAFADRQAKEKDAMTLAQNAINTVSALTPEGFPANRTTLQSARTMLQTARQDLRVARQDLNTIRQSLGKGSSVNSNEKTGTAVGAPTQANQ